MKASARTFHDRRDAGRVLARDLCDRISRPDAGDGDLGEILVLGLARGGVPVGWEVAQRLKAPLDVCLVRKLGAPQWPELAIGALAGGGGVVLNNELIRSLGVGEDQIRDIVCRETAELHRREKAYRGDRGPVTVSGRTVVLVDDGIATGASMIAAVRSVREAGARRIIVGVPVGPRAACRLLRSEADLVVCSTTPPNFRAVGQVYADFHQVSDEEVRELLAAG
ncbi:phosphoribosyltransferase [Mycolicibacterium sp. PAM1]|uniref:Phosphoribosyltransferase n=1 Tax=Mycolicibacterium gilvum (strain PYR-GCK) TaxID=350054 RepID=A4TBD6_MYCGI|nr:phosphoribosyltransferase [Mycolicibacterium sp. PAM1]ABP45475.1 phosphoribosyltransferase [Mycolicibacterium gilvum PYR-GCK]MBV5243307.1 phosphoribosyltransferase [Mycolicibacterium sp. PAM1]